jgi:hypothetical protein
MVFWSLSGNYRFYHRWVDNAHSATDNLSGSTREGKRYEGGPGWAEARLLGTNFRKGAKILAGYKKRLSSDPNGWFDGQAWFQS